MWGRGPSWPHIVPVSCGPQPAPQAVAGRGIVGPLFLAWFESATPGFNRLGKVWEQ
jgi:hypothetical protein